jgi:hypothetical protein
MSYIYSYQGAEKLKNTGFAKIEARGEACRMEIHIKGAYPKGAVQSNVYGFYEERGLLVGIYLGTFAIKNGIGDTRIITDRNHMGNTKKTLEDLQGIYLTLNEEEDNAMASTWDNIKVDTSYFKVFSEEMDEPPFSGGEVEQSAESECAEEEDTPLEEITALQEREMAAEPEQVAEFQQVGESQQEENFQQTADDQQTIELQQPAPEKMQEDNVPEKERVQAAETVLEEQSCACGELNFSVENFTENNKSCGLGKWKEMLRDYPVVNPFDYLDNVEVIRIEPKDISKLEKKYWALANNSFLLHGYCSYRYLILGRNISDNTFFVGIPGVFHPREKMMAGMFGFSQFQMSRNGKLRQGEFGYYIRNVELD